LVCEDCKGAGRGDSLIDNNTINKEGSFNIGASNYELQIMNKKRQWKPVLIQSAICNLLGHYPKEIKANKRDKT
jgi:hypothetical protein